MRGCNKSTQKKLHAKNAVQHRWNKDESHNEPVQVGDPKMMAIACIENGSTFTKSRGILAAQGKELPQKSGYYYNQKKVNATIKELCQESLKKEAENMEPNTIITLDSAYAHRRNSSMCHAVFINHQTNKIVAGSIVTKVRKSGDFYGSFNMLETECIKRYLQQIDMSKVSKYCHDRDNKIPGIMANAKPDINEMIDANHARKVFETCWKKLINDVYNTAISIKNCAINNAKKAVSFVTNVEYKKKFYRLKKNVEYIWKKDVQNEFLRNDFHLFVNDAGKIFQNVDPNVSINKNESLHAEASRIADKNVPWGKDSFEARIAYTYRVDDK